MQRYNRLGKNIDALGVATLKLRFQVIVYDVVLTRSERNRG